MRTIRIFALWLLGLACWPACAGSNDGYLAATLSLNVGTPLLFWDWKLTVIDAANQTHALTARRDNMIQTQLFVDALPAGDYRLTNLSAQFMDRTLASIDCAGLNFHVAAGSVSYLGNLAVLRADASSAGKARIGGHVDLREAQRLRPAFPQAAQAAPLVAGWGAAAATGLEALYRETDTPYGGFSMPSRDTKGRLMAGNRFGRVMQREVDGHWTVYSTGATLQMLTTVPLSDGRLLAGGEAGTLILGSADRATWTPLVAPGAGAMLALGHLPTGEIYLASQFGKSVKFFAASERLDGWHSIGDIAMDAAPSMLPHVLGTRVQVGSTPWGLAVSLPLHVIAIYDAQARIWSTQKTREEIQKFWAWADGSIYYQSTGKDVNTVYRSNDRGATWRALYTVASFTSSVSYVAPSIAYKITTASQTQDGKKVNVSTLSRSNDDGLNWTPVSRFPDRSGGFYAIDPAAVRVIAVAEDSLVLVSTPGAKPWSLEYPLPSSSASGVDGHPAPAVSPTPPSPRPTN